MRNRRPIWLALLALAALPLAWVARIHPGTQSVKAHQPARESAHHSTSRPATAEQEHRSRQSDVGTPVLPPQPSDEKAAKMSELERAAVAALQIADPAQRSSALALVCCRWAELDCREAIERALAWQLEEVPGLLENLALQWATTDLPAARAWAGTQPPGDFRSELVMRVGFAMAQSDPETAAHYVVRETEAGPVQMEAAISVLQQWLQKDPAAASAWADEFPPGALRERAMQEVAGVRQYRQQAESPSNTR